jgi:hypothetical protein
MVCVRGTVCVAVQAGLNLEVIEELGGNVIGSTNDHVVDVLLARAEGATQLVTREEEAERKRRGPSSQPHTLQARTLRVRSCKFMMG